MRFIVLAASVLTLAACQTPCPAVETGPVNVVYACEDESTLRVTYTRQPDAARVAQEGYPTLTLPVRLFGASYRYAEGGAELRGRRNEVRWTRPGAAETVCDAVA